MPYTKPLLKRSHHVLVSDEGDVCIGEIPGKSKMIIQPPSWIVPVLEMLDGSHTVPRICKELAAKGHPVPSEDLIRAGSRNSWPTSTWSSWHGRALVTTGSGRLSGSFMRWLPEAESP